MSSPLLHREPLQQPPPPSPSRWCVRHEEVEEHRHQLTRHPSGGEALVDSLSLTRSTDSTVADFMHGHSGDGCHDGEWRLGYGNGSTESSCVISNGQDDGSPAEKEADGVSAMHEEKEVYGGSLGPASCRTEHTEHWPHLKRGEPGEEQERAREAISASQQSSSAPRRSLKVGSDNCTSPNAEAGANCSRSVSSLILKDDNDVVALGTREISSVTRYRIGSGDETNWHTSRDTPGSSRCRPSHHSTGAAANQRFENATRQDGPPRTSRKLVYSASGTMRSTAVAHNDIGDSGSAEVLATAPIKSGRADDGEDDKAAALLAKRAAVAAVSRGTLEIPCVAASDITDASASVQSDRAALPCSNASPSSSFRDANTSISFSAAHGKATSSRGSTARESDKAATMQDAYRSAPPPCVHSLFELECTEAGVESAMREMAERLRRHSDHGGAVATSAKSDGGVASQGSTPSFCRGQSENPKAAQGSQMEGRRTPSSSFFSPPCDATDDSADVDTVKSAREDDRLAGHRVGRSDMCDAGRFGAPHGGRALDKEAVAPAPAAYEFFSSQLSLPEERRAHIYGFAKSLREDRSHATFPRRSEGLLTSPPAEEHPRDSVGEEAPPYISYTTGETSLFLAEAIRVSADAVTLSSQNTPMAPLHGEALALRQQELMGAGLQVRYSNSGLRGESEEPQRFPGLSGPPYVPSSASGGMSRAATDEGVSTAVAASAELILDSSATPSRTPCTSRRQRPPPRMLCPPTPSPSPPRSLAMDTVFTAAVNVEEREELAAGITEQSFPEVAPGAEPKIRLHVSSATALPRQSALELYADQVLVDAADEIPSAAATATVNSMTSSLCRTPLRLSSSVPVVPAGTALSASALAADTGANAGAYVDAKVGFFSFSSSCHEGTVEVHDGALAEPRAAAVILASPGDLDGPLTLSPRCASSEPSQPQLHQSGHTFACSACPADSVPQQVGVVAIERGSSVACEGVTSCGASHGSASPRNAAVTAAVPLARHGSPADDSPTLPVYATPFTHGEPSAGGMSPPLVPLEGCWGACRSGSNSSAARGYTEVDSTADAVDGSADGMVCGQFISPRPSASARESPLTAAEDEENPYVQSTPLSSSAASPSPIRPPIWSASSKEWLLCEASTLHFCISDGDDEAHLRYDAETSAPVEPAAVTTDCPTSQRETLSDVYDDDDVGDDSDREDITEQASVAEALRRAEANSAVLRLKLTSATERAVAAEANARAWESECAELHTLVSQMQAELAAVQATAEWAAAQKRVDAEAQTVSCTNSVSGVAASALSSPESPNRLGQTTFSRRGGAGPVEGTDWRHRHDIVAQELVTLKACMAEQLAVLDRLGMQPPFSEELVCLAERRLRHVKVVHAPGTAMRASHAGESLSERSHTPTGAAWADNAASLGSTVGSASAAATTKRMQASNSNKIADLLKQCKQNRHCAQLPAAAMASGATGSAAASRTLVAAVQCDDSAHRAPLLDDKENYCAG